MLEMFLSEVAVQVTTLIVIGLVAVITVVIKRALDWWKAVTGIEIAEWEAYHTAKSLLSLKGDYEELFTEILQKVEYKLDRRGIKIDSEELYDLISSTLADIKDEKKD